MVRSRHRNSQRCTCSHISLAVGFPAVCDCTLVRSSDLAPCQRPQEREGPPPRSSPHAWRGVMPPKVAAKGKGKAPNNAGGKAADKAVKKVQGGKGGKR